MATTLAPSPTIFATLMADLPVELDGLQGEDRTAATHEVLEGAFRTLKRPLDLYLRKLYLRKQCVEGCHEELVRKYTKLFDNPAIPPDPRAVEALQRKASSIAQDYRQYVMTESVVKIWSAVLYYNLLPILTEYFKDEDIQTAAIDDTHRPERFYMLTRRAVVKIQNAIESEKSTTFLFQFVTELKTKRRCRMRAFFLRDMKVLKSLSSYMVDEEVQNAGSNECAKKFHAQQEVFTNEILRVYKKMIRKTPASSYSALGDEKLREYVCVSSAEADEVLQNIELEFIFAAQGTIKRIPRLEKAFREYEKLHKDYLYQQIGLSL